MSDRVPPPPLRTPFDPMPPYAPPTQGAKPPFVVLAAGLTTTALALGVAWFADVRGDEHIMGWYSHLIIPVGAILIGLIATSGYGIGSWLSGVKIQRGLLALIVFLQIFAYFAAHYIEFHEQGPLEHEDTGAPVTFPEYFHFTTTSMVWKTNPSTSSVREAEPQPVGNIGYLIRLGELIGFVGGSALAPLLLLKHPYCEACQLYMKKKTLVWIPASRSKPLLSAFQSKGDESMATPSEMADSGAATRDELLALATANDVSGFRGRIDELLSGSKAASKLPHRIRLELTYCKQCGAGRLSSLAVAGSGKQIKSELIGTPQEVSPDLVRALI